MLIGDVGPVEIRADEVEDVRLRRLVDGGAEAAAEGSQEVAGSLANAHLLVGEQLKCCM
jgi:hypothetical protein